jgi:carbon starvation protein
MHTLLTKIIWILITLLGVAAVTGIALNRGEHINALWFVAAALSVYSIAYRFYASWIAAKY